jgi:alpha/beta hydrolase fold
MTSQLVSRNLATVVSSRLILPTRRRRILSSSSTGSIRSTTSSSHPAPPLLCVMTARAPQQSQGGFVQLPDQTQLPYLQQSGRLNLVVAHGLGVDPPQKNHLNDISFDLWQECHQILASTHSSSSSSSSSVGSIVYYTARGHGHSHGWEPSREEATEHHSHRLAQAFAWPALARDMATVIDERFPPDTQVTLFGQSMGAATALLYAMNHPQRIQALLLARLPRIWEARQAVLHDYVQAAQQYQQQHSRTFHYLPLLGASQTDLPLPIELSWKNLAEIPILILGHGDDPAHPLQSAGWLQERVVPHATREDTAVDETAARTQWPRVMAEWLIQQQLV